MAESLEEDLSRMKGEAQAEAAEPLPPMKKTRARTTAERRGEAAVAAAAAAAVAAEKSKSQYMNFWQKTCGAAPQTSSAATASADQNAASADQKWAPPNSDEEDVERKELIAALKGKLRPGVDFHNDDGGWASRKELRSKGHGKGSRLRGGGPRAQWMTKWHRVKKQGIKWADFVKANPEPPRSAASVL